MEVTTPQAEVAPDPQATLEALFSKAEGKPPKAEAPEPEDAPEEEPQDEPEVDAEDAEEVADQPEAPKDDSEDVDLDGEVFKLPKKVKEAVLRQKDYTTKTQELASLRRITEDKQQYVEAREQLVNGAFKEAAQVESLKSQLEAYKMVDWNELIQADPQQAMRLNFGKQQLENSLKTAEAELQNVSQRIRTAQEQHKAKQLELGRAELQRRLGTVKEEDRTAMLALGHELGFDDRDLMSPAAIEALALAAKYKKLQASKPAIDKKVSQARPFTQPAARTSQLTNEASKSKQMQDRYRKTGRSEDVEAFLAARIESKRKR
jgi:hypothetical protein